MSPLEKLKLRHQQELSQILEQRQQKATARLIKDFVEADTAANNEFFKTIAKEQRSINPQPELEHYPLWILAKIAPEAVDDLEQDQLEFILNVYTQYEKYDRLPTLEQQRVLNIIGKKLSRAGWSL